MSYDDISRSPRCFHPAGYVYVKFGPRYVREHVAIAAVALGKPIPRGVVIHHANEVRSDNRRYNLVICQDEAYHKALHWRMRVRAAGGDPWRDAICSTCKRVKPVEDFHKRHGRPTRECKDCACARVRQYSATNREAINSRQRARRKVA